VNLQEVEGKLRKEEVKLREVEGKLREGEEKLRKVEWKPREVEGKLREVDEKLRKGEEKLRKVETAGVAITVTDITGKITDANVAPLEEKELLLREAHNHARNNMYAIIALMEMQRKTLGKPRMTAAALSALESRIRSMALIHERLYQSHNPSHIDFQDYLSALVSHLRTSLDAPPELVCSVDAAGIALKFDTAVPVGIIVNELVTNTLKYAFPKNQPCFGADRCEMMISLERKDAEYTLIVDDNGVGLPKMSSLAKEPALGLRLVRMLGVDQLGGKLTLNRTRGTRFVLRFNVKQ
jgi:two-component sensor histidine kinase